MSGAFTSKNGFSVVAPISVSRPSSTAGRSASCCALLNRWTSSRKRMVPRPSSAMRVRARPMTSRTSRTPADTADRATNSRSVCAATTRASVVLPVPGGPQRMIDDRRSVSMSARSGAPGPIRCAWPTISPSVPGRILAASGACWASRSRNTVSTRSSGGGPAWVLRAGTRRRLPAPADTAPRAAGGRRVAVDGRPTTPPAAGR
jgi:hypothetical protein